MDVALHRLIVSIVDLKVFKIKKNYVYTIPLFDGSDLNFIFSKYITIIGLLQVNLIVFILAAGFRNLPRFEPHMGLFGTEDF